MLRIIVSWSLISLLCSGCVSYPSKPEVSDHPNLKVESSIKAGITYAADEHISFPADVSSFIEQRELCDHFRGEDPYDAERRAFLEKSILELCTGTDLALAKLKSKYINNQQLTSRLSQYED